MIRLLIRKYVANAELKTVLRHLVLSASAYIKQAQHCCASPNVLDGFHSFFFKSESLTTK